MFSIFIVYLLLLLLLLFWGDDAKLCHPPYKLLKRNSKQIYVSTLLSE